MQLVTSTPVHRQTVVSSDRGMVTANHHLAAEAGATILGQGGNAVDAAVATAFAVGVVEPGASGIGGRGYLVIHIPATGESVVVDGHERAPMAACPDMFEVEDARGRPTAGWGPQVPVKGDANAVGHLAVAVPGVVPALYEAHRRYGRLPWAQVLAPGTALAEDGFEVSVTFAVGLAQHRAKLARFPATAAIFFRDGQPLLPGSRLRQPDLARSYRLIAEQGPDALYRGELARAIIEEMARGGGILCTTDLTRFRPRIWDAPLRGSYRDYQIMTVPEATGGITLLQALNLLEGFDLAALDPLGAPALHLILEALEIAFVDRLAVLDDPAFRPVPFGGLASKAFAAERRKLISPECALGEVEPGDARPFEQDGAPSPAAHLAGGGAIDSDTTQICAVDRDRMIVSLTQSVIDPYGSGVVVPGTGILLNSAMHNFTPVPDQLGSIASWKRSVHNGVPTIVLDRDGAPVLAVGGAGGTKIITGVVQVMINVLDHGMTVQDAVEAPRVHHEGNLSEVDAGLGRPVIDRLCELGHRPSVVSSVYARPAFSRINGIQIMADGRASSGVDPLSDAGAAALPGAVPGG
jgi:gamma-glutamyltranspeptidase/glutathione hydrolase